MSFLSFIFKTIDKNQVIRHIEDEVQFSLQYFIMLFLSVVIATLGLIINNNAIIIGAMLLSPLIWPIIGISLATVRSKKNLMKQSLALLIISLIVILATAFIISLISPFKEVSSEMMSRVNPTLYDLVIALAAGLAGTLILTWPKFSDALAGVAIAASLLPPICVTGIGLAFQSQDIAYGSFLLFLTNLSSIIFAGILVFSFAQFYRRDDEDYVKRLSIGLFASIIILGVISVQLIFSLRQILMEDSIEYTVRNVISTELQEISGAIQIDHVSIHSVSQQNISVRAEVKTPTHIMITIKQKEHIVEELSQKLQRSVSLNMNITQFLEAVSYNEEQEHIKKIQQKINQSLSEFTKNISSLIEIQSIDFTHTKNNLSVSTVWQVPDSINVTISDRKNLERQLALLIKQPVEVKIGILRFYRLDDNYQNVDGIEATGNLLQDHVADFLNENQIDTGIRFDYVDVVYNNDNFTYTVILGVKKANGIEVTAKYIQRLRESLNNVFSPVDDLIFQVESQNYSTDIY